MRRSFARWYWHVSDKEKKKYKEEMQEKAKLFYCLNKKCKDYGKRGKGNMVFHWKYGKEDTQNLYRCITCKHTISERRGTPLFGFKLEEKKIFLILKCLVEDNGVRATARIADVDKDTVTKVVKEFGAHMKKVHNFFMQDIHMEECQLDELWTFIKKKRRT